MKVKTLNYSKGRSSEENAKQFLIDKGFVYIQSNYEIDIGEIDLIMSDRDWLVFVEVKYKGDDYMGLPEEMITRRKMSQVKRVAMIYLQTNPQLKKVYDKYRLDAVCILGSKIRHYPNVYA